MATTLTSAITEINISRLKRDLEALGDIRVISITPPKGVIPTTIVLTRGDRQSNLTPSQETVAQNLIDNHVDGFDESGQVVARNKVTIGTIETGTIDFTNNGLAWRIGTDRNLVPGASGRNIGSPTNPVNIIYANTIVGGGGGGGGGGAASVYNQPLVGLIDGVNTEFLTSNPFLLGTTRVFLNGIRLSRGLSSDYVESANNKITLAFSPEPGDEMIIDYDLDPNP